MEKKARTTLSNLIADRLTPELKLLSETENCLQYTPEYPAYERQFAQWRRALKDTRNGGVELAEIRSQIVALRRAMRLSGYDLSLGLVRLNLDGFRSDEALAQGFRRLVICFSGTALYTHSGSDNHLVLAEQLSGRLEQSRLLIAPTESHYLWYRRTARELTLSGSATETKEAYQRLRDRAAANPLKLLTALKQLR